jgi:phage tail-like protein
MKMRAAEIRRLLPSTFRRAAGEGSVLSVLLEVMEEIHEPVERALAHLPSALDPRTAPEEFIPFLAGWVDVGDLGASDDHSRATARQDSNDELDDARLRALTVAAADLARWRGTRRGLVQLLEIATGVPGFDVVEGVAADGVPRPFSIDVVVPPAAAAQLQWVTRIVGREKPAYATCTIRVAPSASGTSNHTGGPP